MKIRSILLYILFGLLILAALGFGFVVYARTFISWWVPVLIAIVPGLLTAPLYYKVWQRMLSLSNAALGIIIHIVIVGLIFADAFLGINYFCAPAHSIHEEQAVVAAKWQEERTRYRRGARGYSVPADTYRVYFVRYELPDSSEYKREVPASQYIETRVGRKHKVEVGQGLFGFPIVRE